jgi:hypothetical protein
MYNQEDYNIFSTLFQRATADQQTLDNITRLYRKYIQPGAPAPRTNCDCAESVSAYFNRLRDFWVQNQSKFNQ